MAPEDVAVITQCRIILLTAIGKLAPTSSRRRQPSRLKRRPLRMRPCEYCGRRLRQIACPACGRPACDAQAYSSPYRHRPPARLRDSLVDLKYVLSTNTASDFPLFTTNSAILKLRGESKPHTSARAFGDATRLTASFTLASRRERPSPARHILSLSLCRWLSGEGVRDRGDAGVSPALGAGTQERPAFVRLAERGVTVI